MNFLKKTLTYSSFATNATSQEVEIYVPAKDQVLGPVLMLVGADFAGGSVNACNVSVGPNGTETALLANTDVFTGCAADDWDNAATGPFVHADLNAGAVNVWLPVAAGTSIRAKMNASHNTNTLNAGVLSIYIGVSDVEKFQA